MPTKRRPTKKTKDWTYSPRKAEPTKAQADRLQEKRDHKNEVFELKEKIKWWEETSRAREQAHRATEVEYLRRSLVNKPNKDQLEALTVICELGVDDCVKLGILRAVETLCQWRENLKERDPKQMALPLAGADTIRVEISGKIPSEMEIPLIGGGTWQPVAMDSPPEHVLVRDGRKS
jgi:hypothetical protein